MPVGMFLPKMYFFQEYVQLLMLAISDLIVMGAVISMAEMGMHKKDWAWC
jgi:hypothetical protein